MRSSVNIVLLLALTYPAYSAGLNLPTFGSAAGIIGELEKGAITAGEIYSMAYMLPLPEEFTRASMNQLLGTSYAPVYAAYDKAVCPVITSQVKKSSSNPGIIFQLRTPCQVYNYNLTNLKEVARNPDFDARKDVVIMVSGYGSGTNGGCSEEISPAYNCRGDVNYFVIDNNGLFFTVYEQAAANAELVGQNIATGLQTLTRFVRFERMHLIGHSIGAHAAGIAGRHFKRLTGKTLSRITGLDPAKPCFKTGARLTTIKPNDAKIVDIIHTSSGVFGELSPLGKVDYYPGGFYPMPPGCVEYICGHFSSCSYYAESVYPGNERNFMAKNCDTLENYRSGKCTSKAYPMGYAIPNNLMGIFISEVNPMKPYGKGGSKKRTERLKACGLCQKK